MACLADWLRANKKCPSPTQIQLSLWRTHLKMWFAKSRKPSALPVLSKETLSWITVKISSSESETAWPSPGHHKMEATSIPIFKQNIQELRRTCSRLLWRKASSRRYQACSYEGFEWIDWTCQKTLPKQSSSKGSPQNYPRLQQRSSIKGQVASWTGGQRKARDEDWVITTQYQLLVCKKYHEGMGILSSALFKSYWHYWGNPWTNRAFLGWFPMKAVPSPWGSPS